jgi:hypothetical protein
MSSGSVLRALSKHFQNTSTALKSSPGPRDSEKTLLKDTPNASKNHLFSSMYIILLQNVATSPPPPSPSPSLSARHRPRCLRRHCCHHHRHHHRRFVVVTVSPSSLRRQRHGVVASPSHHCVSITCGAHTPLRCHFYGRTGLTLTGGDGSGVGGPRGAAASMVMSMMVCVGVQSMLARKVKRTNTHFL